MSASEATRSNRGSVIRVLARGLVAACPSCGGRGLFHRSYGRDWMRIRTTCPTYGLVFERTHGHWIGAVAVNTVMTSAVVISTMVTAFVLVWPDLDVVPLLVPTVTTSLVAPLALAPISRTLWTAMVVLVLPVDDPPGTGRPGAPR